MKHLALTLLATEPLVACAASPACESPTPCTSPYGMPLPDKPVYVGDDELFCYLRLPQDRNIALRHALANCEELELVDEEFLPSGQGTSTLTLRCEGALADALSKLAEVPQWLCLHLYQDADIDYGGYIYLILRDAKGQQLWKGDPFEVAFQKSPGAVPMSLHAVLVKFFPKE